MQNKALVKHERENRELFTYLDGAVKTPVFIKSVPTISVEMESYWTERNGPVLEWSDQHSVRAMIGVTWINDVSPLTEFIQLPRGRWCDDVSLFMTSSGQWGVGGAAEGASGLRDRQPKTGKIAGISDNWYGIGSWVLHCSRASRVGLAISRLRQELPANGIYHIVLLAPWLRSPSFRYLNRMMVQLIFSDQI